MTGCRPDDIDIVVNTHLHFDHAGGNTVELNGPQFPNARYLVSRSEFTHATNPHERDRASYLPSNWLPVVESGQFETMPDSYEPIPGLRLETIRGHSETMQTWRLDRGGRTVYGFADLIPTRHHLPPAWIMGYDLFPTETLEFKKRILPQAVAENWLCLFYHDPDTPLCRLIDEENKIRAIAA
jgi:glyoxylase-like metal-dependent hydrolase (beta-lactamase superfamily II)